MNPTLTITIESADYLRADRELRVTRDEFKPGVQGNAGAIIRARQILGFSMEKQHVLSDYDPDKDGDLIYSGSFGPISE